MKIRYLCFTLHTSNNLTANKMTIKEGRELIEILKKENEENTPEEREFNIEWIRLLNESILNALSKRI